MPSKDVTITTEVQAISYEIIYDLSDGNVDVVYPDSYTMNSLTLSLKNPERE